VTDENQQNRSHLAVLGVGAIPFLVLAAAHWTIKPLARFGDWAQYMSHADALRHGRPYGDIGYIFTRLNPYIGPPVQPPGLPAVLAPLLAITGGARDSALYKLFMVACVLTFLAAVAVYFTRIGGRQLALATVLLTGLWLETGFATNAVQPDVAFCALVWGVFWLGDRPNAWGWRRVIAITLLGLAALAFRIAAVPLVPALGLYALLHRRDAGARAWVPFIVWCVCGLGAMAVVPGSLTFARLIPRDLTVLLPNVVTAAKIYPFAVLDLFLYPLPWNRANDVYHLAICGLAAVGFTIWIRTAVKSLLAIFALCYVGMLLVLPMQDGRYLMPLAPLAIYLAALGIAVGVRRVGARMHRDLTIPAARRAALAVTVAIAAAALGQELTRPAPVALMDAPGMTALFGRLRAARDTAPVRALFMNPRVLTWETGIPAMGFFRAEADTTLAEFRARRITHVVTGDLGTDGVRARSIEKAVKDRPDAFRQLFTEGVFTVYAFDSTRMSR
jgi:hypothetical protein